MGGYRVNEEEQNGPPRSSQHGTRCTSALCGGCVDPPEPEYQRAPRRIDVTVPTPRGLSCDGKPGDPLCRGAVCVRCEPIRSKPLPWEAKPAEAKEKEFLPMGKRHKPGCDVLDPGQDQYECDCPDRATLPTDEEVRGQGGERHDISLEAAQKAISDECDAMKAFLLDKNKKYGNSAFQPINVMSRLSPLEGIKLRIDDKLKRMQMGDGTATEDTVKDLAGYYILHGAAKRLGL